MNVLRGLIALLILLPLGSFAKGKLFHDFVRVHPDFGEKEANEVKTFFQGRATEVKKYFPYLIPPEDLILVVSKSLEDENVYRVGELILPYRFNPEKKKLDEVKQQGLAYPMWDYYFGLALFEANMIFEKGESRTWDSYRESYDLLRKLYLLYSHIDEDVYYWRIASNTERQNMNEAGFQKKHAAKQKALADMITKIKRRNTSERVRYADAYVFELLDYFATLFADLYVAVQYHDPDKVSSFLQESGIPSYVASAPYRSFSSPRMDPETEPLAYKSTHFFSPLRPYLWQEINGNGRSKAQQLKSLDSLFLRMRVVMRDLLKEIDKKTFSGDRFNPIGDGPRELLRRIGFDRESLTFQLHMSYCEEQLVDDESRL